MNFPAFFVLQCGDDLAAFRVDHFTRGRICKSTVESKRNPAGSNDKQIPYARNVSLGIKVDFRVVVQFNAIIEADPVSAFRTP